MKNNPFNLNIKRSSDFEEMEQNNILDFLERDNQRLRKENAVLEILINELEDKIKVRELLRRVNRRNKSGYAFLRFKKKSKLKYPVIKTTGL